MRRSVASFALALSLAVPVAAQTAAPAPAQPASPKPAEPAASKAADGKSAEGKAGSGKAAEGKDEGARNVGGFAWKDKPRRAAARRPKRKLAPNTPIANFPAFRRLPNGSTAVTVALTKPTKVNASAFPGGIVELTFEGAALLSGVTGLALPTTHFESPIARVQLREGERDVTLVITLRESIKLQHRTRPTADGGLLVEVFAPKPQQEYADPETQPRERVAKLALQGEAAPLTPIAEATPAQVEERALRLAPKGAKGHGKGKHQRKPPAPREGLAKPLAARADSAKSESASGDDAKPAR